MDQVSGVGSVHATSGSIVRIGRGGGLVFGRLRLVGTSGRVPRRRRRRVPGRRHHRGLREIGFGIQQLVAFGLLGRGRFRGTSELGIREWIRRCGCVCALV